MINNLSEELNVMRPAMMETGLESIAYNLNRKNSDLKFFEFGKTYLVDENGRYAENNHLALYVTGYTSGQGWKEKARRADFYYLKAVLEKIIRLAGLNPEGYKQVESEGLSDSLEVLIQKEPVAQIGMVSPQKLERFDIKQPVLYADLDWDKLLALNRKAVIEYREISKYPAVNRDLAIVVDKPLPYDAVEKAALAAGIKKLKSISLFDIFESEKIGAGKKSMAVSFTFQDVEKTLTDKEIDGMMNRIIASFEKELNAEIRK